MEVLLNILREYGLFIGIVVGTIVLIWVTYAIYNAVVRAKANQVRIIPAVAKTSLQSKNNAVVQEAQPIIPEVKSPSLEGEGVVKTGPRKMSLSDDDDTTVLTPKPKEEPKTTVESHNEPTKVENKTDINKSVEEKVEDLIPTRHSNIQPLPKENEDDMVPAEETLVKKAVTPPLQPTQRRIILANDDDDTVADKPKPKPKAKVIKPVEEKKPEPTKPYAEQKGIIVQKPKPKKKVPPKYHVLYRATDNSWYVKVEGNDAVIGTLETQREAISYATIKALKSDSVVIVHRKDGKIRKQATMKDVTDSEEEE